MAMNDSSPVFLDGAAGFVGSHVLVELCRRGHSVRALVHHAALAARENVRPFRGGLFDQAVVREAMSGCAAAIHLVGIIAEKPEKNVTFERIHVEGTRRVLEAAKEAGVKRYIHMSALGTRSEAVSDYHRTKWQAEELVRGSGLDWTILRPSMIHGPGGEFSKMEVGWARKKQAPWLFMPYFGKGFLGTGGSGQLQPIFVGDVARAFVDCLGNQKTIHQTYTLAGPEAMSWPQMHEHFARAATGSRRATIPIPSWYARLLAGVLPRWSIPFNRDQVIMAEEDNIGDIAPMVRDFGWQPQSLAATVDKSIL